MTGGRVQPHVVIDEPSNFCERQNRNPGGEQTPGGRYRPPQPAASREHRWRAASHPDRRETTGATFVVQQQFLVYDHVSPIEDSLRSFYTGISSNAGEGASLLRDGNPAPTRELQSSIRPTTPCS